MKFLPPIEAAHNAAEALRVRATKPPSQRGMTDVGLGRARQLISRQPLSEDIMRRMWSFFRRHEVDKRGSTWRTQGKGWQAWMGWGGDEAYAWLAIIMPMLDEERDAERAMRAARRPRGRR